MTGLSIIIVNYKTPELTQRCVQSIYDTIGSEIHFEVIIVDNYSQDNSEQIITTQFPSVVWINNPMNEGFGRANNLGINAAKEENILLLNSDIVLLDGAVEKALSKLKQSPGTGVLGSKLLNEDGTQQHFTSTVASFRKILDLNLLFNFLAKEKEYPIKAIMGSFMLFPKKILDSCGTFDPDFFMYSEEIELCNRIALNGFGITYDPEILVIHKNGGSTSDRTWANRQSYLSSALLFYKVRGIFGYMLYHFLIQLNTVTNFFFMWKLDKQYRKDYFKDQKNYFVSYFHYFCIPFQYSRKPGTGKRLLKFGK